METIRLLISLVAQMKWRIYQVDVKSAFINGFLEEDVYIEQPLGYLIKGHEGKCFKLKKILYGLKQRAWNSRIDKYFQDNGFVCCPLEYALYYKIHANEDYFRIVERLQGRWPESTSSGRCGQSRWYAVDVAFPEGDYALPQGSPAMILCRRGPSDGQVRNII